MSTKNTNFTLADITIHPGETANLALPLPELYSCTSFNMPLKVIHGKYAGPCLLIVSTMKGDELNGMEIIKRLVATESFDALAGTLILVPVFNILALISHLKTISYELTLENSFPGKEHGTYGERMAHVFTQEILSKVNYCIELQTGSLNHELLPQVYCHLKDAEARTLAQNFAAPVITQMPSVANSFWHTTEALHIPLIRYQAGEALRLNEPAILTGLQGIRQVLRALTMLPLGHAEETSFIPIFSESQEWVYSHVSGMLASHVELGQLIHRQDVLGMVSDPLGVNTTQPVRAAMDGIVVGINRHPLIHEGQTLFKIASFSDNDRAETALEAWGDRLPDEYHEE
ncbi:MAG: hypothetical protein BGO90_08155 [Legionella sp. 40-6]|nr:succinylglutamate desuccinylase/aspartoacylase family protein [Legionella sp.]OJY25190.1 MAG: hypothetical protein BGO90_08155 [Legionella sp. 40-6]